MGVPSIVIVLTLVLVLKESNEINGIELMDVTETLKFGYEIITEAFKAWKWIDQKDLNNRTNLQFPYAKGMEKRLMNKISLVSRRLVAFEEGTVHQTETIIATILEQMFQQEKLEKSLHDLSKLVGRIEGYFEDFVRLSNVSNKYTRYTIEVFANSCVSPDFGGIPDTLRTIHRLIVPAQPGILDRSILMLLANKSKEASSQICNERQSPQQLLYSLYSTIALTEIKGYAMMQFSWMLLELYDKGNFSEEMQQLKQQYMTRTSETLRAVRTAMAFAPRDMWRCDPAVHEEDITFTELKHVFQSYVINEVDLNRRGTCKENCGYYKYTTVQGCYKNQFCAQQRKCAGDLFNCQYVDSDMWICPSEGKSRRYEYIEYENGRTFGKKGTCTRGVTKVDSWWRWLFWHCSYCICFCDEHVNDSDRYFSLRNVIADVEKNKVITGIRLTKKNYIVHVQIQEGTLLPRGGINVTSIQWKPIENYMIHNAQKGIDYHTLSWKQRALDLDDLKAPPGHLLTGVRFKQLGSHLNFEIMTTPFNFTSGTLIKPLERSQWHSNDNTDVSLDKPRMLLDIGQPDIPTRSSAPAIPDSISDQYLFFMPTDLEKDAGQSTVPFIDIQPVVPYPPVPIAGAGIFHKGRKGFGGYVAAKLFTYDFSPHLQVEFPPTSPIINANNEIGKIEIV